MVDGDPRGAARQVQMQVVKQRAAESPDGRVWKIFGNGYRLTIRRQIECSPQRVRCAAATQQKPAKRGSASVSLAEALKKIGGDG